MAEKYRSLAFEIETERLSLRLRRPDDAAWNLELLGEHAGGTTATLDGIAQGLLERQKQSIESGIGFLSIRRRAQRDAIGYCGLFTGHMSFDEPEIAFELLRRAHGEGYATEAARAVLDAAFATGRTRLWATVRTWNTPSFRVLEKLGFRRDHSIIDERGELVFLVNDA